MIIVFYVFFFQVCQGYAKCVQSYPLKPCPFEEMLIYMIKLFNTMWKVFEKPGPNFRITKWPIQKLVNAV